MRAPFTIIALAAAVLLAGCGSGASTSRTASSRELALQRAQLIHVGEGLRSVEGAVKREVAASRGAWPLIADGLPQRLPAGLQRAVGLAAARAHALVEPPFMRNASRLTGPAAGIAGLYESYERLSERGWRLTEASISSILSRTPAIASFERQNSSLYIDSIYDAHFDLSLLGEHLISAYEQLGGPAAFGTSLPQSELNALAGAYSIPSVRLSPHPAGTAKEG